MNKGAQELARVVAAVDSAEGLAASVFDRIREPWREAKGVGRDSFGRGEQHAHDVIAKTAREMGLRVSSDAVGNLYATLPGRQHSSPGWLCGSHLDSVPAGGNFDGAAGVVAGLTAIKAMQTAGVSPHRDVTVMAIRGEEASSWYDGDFASHIGSRAALGRMDAAELCRARRISTGTSMLEDMRALGLEPPLAGVAPAILHAENFAGYLELHIEQGPLLVEKALPVGIVTGIRGSARARKARCTGEYAHSGAVPQELRRDAVLAAADFILRVESAVDERRNRGEDLVYTAGRFYTNPTVHSLTKVPGEVTFSLDLRSESERTLRGLTDWVPALAAEVAARRRVTIDLGTFNISAPARMDQRLVTSLCNAADDLSIRSMCLASGAGHDCQDFAAAGFSCAMVFVRNDHGSHNPAEAMAMPDFLEATKVLTWQLMQ